MLAVVCGGCTEGPTAPTISRITPIRPKNVPIGIRRSFMLPEDQVQNCQRYRHNDGERTRALVPRHAVLMGHIGDAVYQVVQLRHGLWPGHQADNDSHEKAA